MYLLWLFFILFHEPDVAIFQAGLDGLRVGITVWLAKDAELNAFLQLQGGDEGELVIRPFPVGRDQPGLAARLGYQVMGTPMKGNLPLVDHRYLVTTLADVANDVLTLPSN